MTYEYDYADATVTSIEGVPEESVLELLFEGTEAGGEPAAAFELGYIEDAVDEEFETIKVTAVNVREKDEDHLIFDVIIENTDVTAPAGMPSDDMRVLHESDIPYKYYQVAIVN